MKDGNSEKIKLSWPRKLITKWLNIKRKSDECEADALHGSDDELSKNFSEMQPQPFKKTHIERSAEHVERSFSRPRSHRRGRGYLDHPEVITVQNYSIFVSTWNVGGKPPRTNMSLDHLLHSAPPADIYVLGFQEIVPLNAGNILGAEDSSSAKKWLALIRKMLNNVAGTSGGSGHYTPSPVPFPIAEWNADFEGSNKNKATSFHRPSFQTSKPWRSEHDMLVQQPQLDRRLSVGDHIMFGHGASDSNSLLTWGYRLSDCSSSQRLSDYSSGQRPCSSSQRLSDYSCGQCPSDYSAGNDYSSLQKSDHSLSHMPSDFSRLGSDDDYLAEDSPSTVLCSPSSHAAYAPTEDECIVPTQRYCLVASKQMVGIFLTVWVRSEFRDHVRNIKVSCIGRGLMGYLGNKGYISISMLVHQTSLCFVCSHLTSGQKVGDELRRNADVMEILRKTRFPRVNGVDDEKSPETVLEHDRVLWLGDLNYRIALPFRSAKALIEMQNWRALLDKDQLQIEQRRGRVFEGWKEGKIYFPPTYKYSHNSDKYAGEVMHPKEKQRTPAWCDRILWYGTGLKQLSYVRGESRFSDHRPVSSMFWTEIELVPNRLRKSMSCSRSRIEVEELLPYSHGYTELCFV